MNEHENDTGIGNVGGAFRVLASTPVRAKLRKTDLVLDFSGIRRLDVSNLALILTAQQQAQEEDRSVWLAGVPLEVWQGLHAMGLGGFFKPFPVSGETEV